MRTSEVAEEPRQVRVVLDVVDDEPGVEREPVVHDRVRVAARAVVTLEQLDLVHARQRVGRAQPGDSRSDDCDPHHEPIFARARTTVGHNDTQSMEHAAEIRIRTVRERTTFWSRLAGLVAVIVPPVGLVVGTVLLWNRGVNLALLAVLALFYVPCGLGITVGWHRYFSHKSFETGRVAEGDARDPRLDGDAGAADAVGDRPPQAPRALRPARRSALAARRPRPRAVGARARALALARRLALLDEGPRARAGVREGSLRRHDDPLDRPALPALGRAVGRAAVRDRLGRLRDVAGRDAARWSGAA